MFATTSLLNAVYELPFGPGKTFLNGGGPVGKIRGRLESEQHRTLAYGPSSDRQDGPW